MTSTPDYEPSTSDWVREQVEQNVETGTTDGVTLAGRPIVLITYRGVKSGKLRKTPVMRVEHEGRYAVVASKGGAPAHPQWYPSLIADPTVEMQDGATAGMYRVREVEGEEKAEWWKRAVAAFPDYADYQNATDRQIPVLVLQRVDGG